MKKYGLRSIRIGSDGSTLVIFQAVSVGWSGLSRKLPIGPVVSPPLPHRSTQLVSLRSWAILSSASLPPLAYFGRYCFAHFDGRKKPGQGTLAWPALPPLLAMPIGSNGFGVGYLTFQTFLSTMVRAA